MDDLLLTEMKPPPPMSNNRRYSLYRTNNMHRSRIACRCGRTFIYQKHLTYHQRWECGNTFKCKKCDCEFSSKSYLKIHFNKAHNTDNDDDEEFNENI